MEEFVKGMIDVEGDKETEYNFHLYHGHTDYFDLKTDAERESYHKMMKQFPLNVLLRENVYQKNLVKNTEVAEKFVQLFSEQTK
jgi:hypothetical protein